MFVSRSQDGEEPTMRNWNHVIYQFENLIRVASKTQQLIRISEIDFCFKEKWHKVWKKRGDLQQCQSGLEGERGIEVEIQN